MGTINLLLPEQNEELLALEAGISMTPDFESACRFLVTKIAAILDAPATLLAERAGRWRVVAEAGDVPPVEVTKRRALRAHETGRDSARRASEVAIDPSGWTSVSLRGPGEKALMLKVSGDWTLSRLMLEASALRLGAALRRFDPPRRSTPNRGIAAACALPRRLARATDVPHMCQIIIDVCANAVGAQKGSIAIYEAERDSLSVAATFGYPAVLVRHLRFRPGDGIIGTVFSTKRPLRIDDIRRIDGAPGPRLRYRTTSFMSVPLLGIRDVLGVISVSDRQEDEFSRYDLRTLRTVASIASLALDREKALEDATRFARVAAIDPLTGLFNRRYFLARLEEEVERARRQSSPLTVLMLDVDDFKQLNDRLGHLVGDAVLRVVGDVLRRSVRVFDVCARYGGDEFAILMPGSGPESTRQIAERIREGVEDSRPARGPWSDDLRVTTSIGIATFSGTTGDDLIDRADQALYEAKRDGKNRVRFGNRPDAESGGAAPSTAL